MSTEEKVSESACERTCESLTEAYEYTIKMSYVGSSGPPTVKTIWIPSAGLCVDFNGCVYKKNKCPWLSSEPTATKVMIKTSVVERAREQLELQKAAVAANKRLQDEQNKLKDILSCN